MNETLFSHFTETGAILDGHFRLSSGLHSDRYVQCAQVLMHPDRAAVLCRALAEGLEGRAPDIVVGPAIGGITFAYEMARALGKPGIFAERQDGRFALRRGFSLEAGARVLIAEDVVTTGGSVQEVITLLESMNVEITGVACLVHRAETNPFQAPLDSLLELVPATWSAEECPLCADGDVAVKPGSRPAGKSA